jgi:hypothetical protein
VSSVVVIKTQSMPTPVSVMRDCALEIDASDLRQWQQLAQPRADDQRRFRPPSERVPAAAPPPPPPEDGPGRPRYDAARPQSGLTPQAAEVILRLDIDFESIPDIPAFAEEVRADVANAARLDRSRVAVLNMRAGSTIVELTVDGDGGRSALSIARALKQQAADPASPLRAGQHTKRTLDVMIPADILPRAPGGGAPSGGAPGRPNMQGYIDSQGVFRSRGATSPAPDRTQLQAPIFTTNELALSAGFAPTPKQNAGPRPRQAGRPQRGGGGGPVAAQQNYTGYQALLRPVSPAGTIGGGGGRRSQRAPFAMVQVAVNPQGMHPSILSALKQNVGSPPGPAPVNAGPFGGYYAAFGGGSVGGSVVSYGGSSAGGSVVGGGSVFGGGSVYGDQYPFRLHSSAGALPEFAQQQRPMWGQMQAVQQFGASGGGMAPVFRDQVQAFAGRGQFQGGQGYAMQAFSGPTFAPISAPLPLQMRAMQPNFRFQQQGMSPPRQPIMMQMQAPAAPLMPFQTQVVQPQRMQTMQMQQVPMMHMQPQMVQQQSSMMQPQMMQMQPQMMQMQPQMMQMQPQMQMQIQPQINMHMHMQPQIVQQQPQMIQMIQQPAIQGVWGY